MHSMTALTRTTPMTCLDAQLDVAAPYDSGATIKLAPCRDEVG